ncbi:hypothetical protein NHX12_017848 [Muraenolepis orangiensis]|uniref:rRNA biogenesis protein RRP36 n=1 Tax=Muraenolepis orangiensis TaxID=630683 RepID=A0A9Q0IX22_9TELE|nr:hypothetical protein NHX12_017848 [Muraenolepis orangiensis]
MTAESKNDKSPAVRMRKMALLPSDNREEEDVDMEANFALLTKNRHAQREEEEDSEEYGVQKHDPMSLPELSTMSFEDIVKLQQKVGLKVFNSMAHGPAHVAPPSRRGQKRLNKNRPIEVSSKRRVPYLREVVPVKKSSVKKMLVKSRRASKKTELKSLVLRMPFYLNKGEQNKLQLAEKFEQLKRSGKLDNFLTKKRKRNATKDRKKLPYQNYKHQNPE